MKPDPKVRRRRAKRMTAAEDELVNALLELPWWRRLDVLHELTDRMTDAGGLNEHARFILSAASERNGRALCDGRSFAVPDHDTYDSEHLATVGPGAHQAGACGKCGIGLASSVKRVRCPLCGESARLT